MIGELSLIDILAMMLIVPNGVLPWIGIVETLTAKNGEIVKWPAIATCYTLLSFTALLSLIGGGMLTSVNPVSGEASIYALLSMALASLVILVSEQVRLHFLRVFYDVRAFVRGIKEKLWSDKRAPVKYFNYERTCRRTINRGKPEGYPIPLTSVHGASVRTGARQIRPRPERLHPDRDYDAYLKWCSHRVLGSGKLSYSEFCRIREAVREVLGIRRLREDIGIGIATLSILAKISMKALGLNWGSWDREFDELRRLGLVSRKGKLMPKGVKLVKMLKRSALLEKLADQV